tara:strand:- start:460 stop:729 length:270 start_codon:yes stop_codon:yes gene_type:complete
MRDQRAKNLRHRYGIELEEYDKMLEEQGGLCYICEEPPGKSPLSVDHCHKDGTIRGLLCHNCNHGLGKFKDNIVLMYRAITYLLKERNK